MTPQPHLQLVIDKDTGEVLEDERDILITQLQGELTGKSLQIGKLKKELRELRAVEPEAETIREVLIYWQERCSPTSVIAPAGKRWEKTRARLREPLDGRGPWTPAELKLAIDGALLDPWMNGSAPKSQGYLDPVTIFRDSEMCEKLINLAIGFKAQAGVTLNDILDLTDELRVVNWRHLLTPCQGCDHMRIMHAMADPNFHGWERCRECDCLDFYPDPFNERWAS